MHVRSMVWPGVFALALVVGAAHAGEGDLDPTFDGDGKTRVPFDIDVSKADHVHSVLLQPDGKALVLGTVGPDDLTGLGLARLTVFGARDVAFNGDGDTDGKVNFAGIDLVARGMALQPDGKIVVAAHSSSAGSILLRRAADGAAADFPGAFFGVAVVIPGTTSSEVVDLIGLADGKFLAAGTITTAAGGDDFFVARYTADGILDAGFGTQPGYTRIAFDLSIGGGGDDTAVALARASDGRIAILGTVAEGDHEYGVAMLQSNGMPLMTFDGDGKAVVSFDIGQTSDDRAVSACFSPNGNLFIAGLITETALVDNTGMALLSPAGSLVNDFASNGRRQFPLEAVADVACQADGRFLLFGTVETSSLSVAPTEAVVLSFLNNGDNDNLYGSGGGTAFGLNRPTVVPAGRADRGVAMTLRSDGAVYAAFDAEFQDPDFDFGVARLSGSTVFADGFE